LQILSFESLPSTQTHLKALLNSRTFDAPIAVTCEVQTDGIGSRNNKWHGEVGNLFISFALPLKNLPNDLKIESASIYFSYILKETLAEFGSKVWLKWPNDIYVNNKKVGGMITSLSDNNIICGFGLNLIKAPVDFGTIDITINKKKLLKRYFQKVEKNFLWKQVFSKYKLEFDLYKSFFTHVNNEKVDVSKALLNDDGSLLINGERIYSLR